MSVKTILLAVVAAVTLTACGQAGVYTGNGSGVIESRGGSNSGVTQDGDRQTTTRNGNRVTATHNGNPTHGTARGEDGRRIVEDDGDPIVREDEEVVRPKRNRGGRSNSTNNDNDRPSVVQPKDDADDVEVDDRDEDDKPLFGAD